LAAASDGLRSSPLVAFFLEDDIALLVVDVDLVDVVLAFELGQVGLRWPLKAERAEFFCVCL